MADVQQILEQYWAYPTFRPLQREIIDSVLSGRDTVALLPTGSWSKVETKTFAPFPFVLSQPMRRGVPPFLRRERGTCAGRGGTGRLTQPPV